ncbi:MAG: response regulator [Thermosynechococcus sp.]
MTTSTPAASSVTQGDNKALAFPARVIQKVISDRFSGHLTFTDPRDASIGWNLYVGNGQLHYANSTVGHQERFNYLCQRYCPQLSTTLASDETEYQYLCRLWQQGKLTLSQLRKLLFLFSQEALIHLFAMPQASVRVERVAGLEQLVLCVPIKQTLSQLRQSITQAVQVRTYLNSPLQRLVLTATERIPADLWPMDYGRDIAAALPQLLEQTPVLYEVATQLRMEAIATAELLQPAFVNGFIAQHPYATPTSDTRPIVACIDDSRTIQRNVRLILETCGYRVLGLMEPTHALSALNNTKPNLVLMDISMPEMDGYELCRQLRQTETLKDVPVVMLTGRDGLVDRIRARMVGATDYLTKPFTPQELLSLAERFTHTAAVESH